MNPVVVIPTYVSARRKGNTSMIATYDHTTSITQPGELPRLLTSLTRVNGIGQIIVLVAADPAIEVQAAEKVQGIASNYPNLSIAVIGASEAALVQQRMDQLSIGKLSKEVGLTGYAAIRNLGLVLTDALGYDAVVFLDDDEIVDDPDFLQKAMYGLGKLTKKGIPILAKTGFYYNSDGNYTSKSQNKWYNHFWQQGKAFNHWIEKAMKGPRLSRSNHVCGGCLAIHKEAFKRLSFDPWIARGEDLDYMLDLRMYGSDIWFDNQWSLRHLPPKSDSEGARFRQDIFRWLYEYRKMEYSRTQIDLLQVPPSSLEPYPGPFLKPGITRRIRTTAFLRSLARPDKRAYLKAASAAKDEASSYAQRNCAKYFEFQYVWPELMARIENDRILRTALTQSVMQQKQFAVAAATANEQAVAEQEVAAGQQVAAPAAGQQQAAGQQTAGRQAAAGQQVASAGQRAAAAGRPRGIVDAPTGNGFDPGKTSEIRLNLAE